MTGFIVLFVVLAILLIAFGAYQTAQRRKKFAAWAAANGFAYAPTDPSLVDLPWGAPWGEGHGRKASDVLTGEVDGQQVRCFTYEYETSSGGEHNTDTTHYFAVYMTRLPKQLGELVVGREGFGAKIARAIGFHDIELESEQFNRTYNVHAPNPRFAYDVLHPRMMEWLLSTDAPGFRIYGADLVLVEKNRLTLENVRPELAYLNQIVGQIPDIVWNAS